MAVLAIAVLLARAAAGARRCAGHRAAAAGRAADPGGDGVLGEALKLCERHRAAAAARDGVAFDIYFVMNWRAGQTNHLQSSTARAVLFSALTTMSAFGSLALSNEPGTARWACC